MIPGYGFYQKTGNGDAKLMRSFYEYDSDWKKFYSRAMAKYGVDNVIWKFADHIGDLPKSINY